MPYKKSGRDSSRRAILEDKSAGVNFMPTATRSSVRSARHRRNISNKVRVVRGRVRLHVAGYPGLESFNPSELILHIAVSKLRIAAKKVLRITKQATEKKRQRKGQRKKGQGKKEQSKKARRKIRKTRRRTKE